MEVDFRDSSLDRLEVDVTYMGGFPPAIVRAYRKRLQLVRASGDERTFYALKSLHFEKLKGQRAHQHSMRLNDQWRLVMEFEQRSDQKIVVIVCIEDYH